jgi:DNA-binding CsgD family transcriptional regulator
MNADRQSFSAVIIVSRRGVVRFVSSMTRTLLAKFFGDLREDQLPPPMEAWLQSASDGPLQLFVAEHGGERLTLRLLPTHDPEATVVLVEARSARAREALRCHGLTARESEVLWWVTEGKTNREIGIILGRSPRTVQIHLNNVFRKLGVETRTAAATLALRTSLVTEVAA